MAFGAGQFSSELWIFKDSAHLKGRALVSREGIQRATGNIITP
jgi:hypothetical protein